MYSIEYLLFGSLIDKLLCNISYFWFMDFWNIEISISWFFNSSFNVWVFSLFSSFFKFSFCGIVSLKVKLLNVSFFLSVIKLYTKLIKLSSGNVHTSSISSFFFNFKRFIFIFEHISFSFDILKHISILSFIISI